MNWISLNSMIRKWFRRKPLNVLEGGTGANVPEKACENLGAVKKTGDIVTGTFKYQDTYEGKDSDGNIVTTVTHQHPIVDVPGISEGGMDVVVESAGTRPLFLGSSEQASAVRDSLLDTLSDVDNNLYLASGDSMRFYSGITTDTDSANGLREAMRLNTSGDLVIYPDYAEDGKAYNAFQVRNNEDFVGSIRTSISEENNAYEIGLYTLSKNSKYANRVAIGIDDKGARTVQLGYGSDAWRAALMDVGGKGYGATGSNSAAAKAWGEWIQHPWRFLSNSGGHSVTSVGSNQSGNKSVAKYTVPQRVQEILFYGRGASPSYKYGSTLVLPRNVFTSINDEDGRTFMLGGGWNSTFGGDAARIRLTYKKTYDDKGKENGGILTLYVLGVSVGGSWIDNAWVLYWR